MTASTEQERAEFERVALAEDWARSVPQHGLVFWDHPPNLIAWKAWQAARRAPAHPQRPQFEQCQDAFDAAKNRYPQGNPLGGDHEWHWFQAGWNGRAPVVPDIPTKTMLKAAQKADCDHSPFNEWLQDNGRDFIAMYRAAISAVPTPPLPNCNAA